MPDDPSQRKKNGADLDPVTTSSKSLPILVAALLLVLVLAWSLFDDAFGQRPWKRYQRDFAKRYTSILQKQISNVSAEESRIRQSLEFAKLNGAVEVAERDTAPKLAEIDREMSQELTPQISSLNQLLAEVRGEVQAIKYQMDTSSSASTKQSLQKQISNIEGRSHEISLRVAANTKKLTLPNYAALVSELDRLKARRAELDGKRAELTKPLADLREKRDAYLSDHLHGLSSAQLNAILLKTERSSIDIRQIYNADGDIVDRCESCHLGIREPLKITKADMGGEAVFTSHPSPELLKIHDPQKFGCTSCHNGNGRATTSTQTAHGENENWPSPLFRGANIEAGCQRCHDRDFELANAESLNLGKRLFTDRGCSGCHRYDGYDSAAEQSLAVQQEISFQTSQRHQTELSIEKTIAEGDQASDNAEARRLYSKADQLKIAVSDIDRKLDELSIRSKNLLLERKTAGPNLKEVRVKLNRSWIPTWIEDPQAFRPGTKMPKFRLDADERRAIAAFVWQSGVDGVVPQQAKGDEQRGKEFFETRGCLGCHSIGEGSNVQGGTFAANLSREGEKVNYDYLVRWIRNPRERTRPFCPVEKRDIGPEDYARHEKPFSFDVDHAECPNDGHQLVVEQPTVMPSLRLSLEEARDIATYLMTQKKREPGDYPPAPFLDDPSLKEKGRALVRRYGCAGCHEIAGLEDEPRSGVDLTREGSKPLERFDFGLMIRRAKQDGWYNPKGYLDRKISQPALFDQGKELQQSDRLRMPDYILSAEEKNSLTTFLLGSVDTNLPASLLYHPEDQRRAVQEGWKIVVKYNCMGCHILRAGQRSALMELPRYRQPEWKEQLPPPLIGEGARVDPVWLSQFLSNPALNDKETDRNGVRPYLKARMPTFFLSDDEVGKLVRFFAALSGEPQPYIPPKLEPLTEQERSLARQLFTSQGAPCLKCHATGDAQHDAKATAPSYILSRARLRPGWTRRWMIDPASMVPGTNMPSGLFRQENGRLVFAGPLPPSFDQYKKDHVDLLVRYMFEFTAEEQRRLGAAGTN